MCFAPLVDVGSEELTKVTVWVEPVTAECYMTQQLNGLVVRQIEGGVRLVMRVA